MTPTPATLRATVPHLEMGNQYALADIGEKDDRISQAIGDVLASADAWEAQVMVWRDAYDERDRAYNGLVKRLEEAERLCPGCGHSLAQCYDDARSGRMRPGPCCPDCNHSAGAFVAPDDSGGAQEETK
jgi:hypothetical protein